MFNRIASKLYSCLPRSLTKPVQTLLQGIQHLCPTTMTCSCRTHAGRYGRFWSKTININIRFLRQFASKTYKPSDRYTFIMSHYDILSSTHQVWGCKFIKFGSKMILAARVDKCGAGHTKIRDGALSTLWFSTFVSSCQYSSIPPSIWTHISRHTDDMAPNRQDISLQSLQVQTKQQNRPTMPRSRIQEWRCPLPGSNKYSCQLITGAQTANHGGRISWTEWHITALSKGRRQLIMGAPTQSEFPFLTVLMYSTFVLILLFQC